MKKYLLILLFFVTVATSAEIIDLEKDIISDVTNYRIYPVEAGVSKWVGYPDPNYSFEGDRLIYERMVKDENDKDVLVKTYKNPIEIIADFKAESKVYGEENIQKAVSEKFRSALIGYVWVDKVIGGGEVVMPFTAPHVFQATGDRLNPVLSEISTDTSDDNYYEIVDGKTHVYVKAFSGIGLAAETPSVLIAHYKMNEDTADDADELVTNGAAPTDLTGWSQDPGTQWSVVGNKFQGAGNSVSNYLTQDFGAVVGRKYKFSYDVTDNSLVGGTSANQLDLSSSGAFALSVLSSAVGTHTYYTEVVREADANNQLRLFLRGNVTGGTIDVDNFSIKLLAVEDSSGNDHDGLLAAEDTDEAHVDGKINGAFDFDGSTDYMIIPDHDDFTPAGTPLSFSIWINPHDATNLTIASKGTYNIDGEWLFWVNASDKLEVRRFDESVASCYIGRTYDTTLTSYQDQWIHLVWTSDGGTESSGDKLYINGKQVDDTNEESNAGSFVAVENLDHDVWIGNDVSGIRYANGLFDNAMIFSTDLDIFEIQDLYNHGSGTEIVAEINERRGRRSRH